MSSTDKLSIIVDEVNESFQPAETFMDPVGKLRTSQPQALIDTDFEYGVQSTKWETLSLSNNRASAFYDPTQGISSLSSQITTPGGLTGVYAITALTGNGTRLVTVSINKIEVMIIKRRVSTECLAIIVKNIFVSFIYNSPQTVCPH